MESQASPGSPLASDLPTSAFQILPGITDMHHGTQFYVVLRIKPGASAVLGKHSTNRLTTLAPKPDLRLLVNSGSYSIPFRKLFFLVSDQSPFLLSAIKRLNCYKYLLKTSMRGNDMSFIKEENRKF